MDPQSEALRFRLRMTKNVSFPRKRESRQDWIPHQVRDDGGDGSPIRSASLSVEDDKECVIPAKTGIQSEWIPSQVGDGKGCVIPMETGIQSGLDPQSEALRFRLGMAREQSVGDDKGAVGWG